VDLSAGPDLKPRPPGEGPRRRGGRTWGAAGALALVAAAGGAVLWQGLSNATLYFCNADEVGQRDACMEDDRFRLQGRVVPGSVQEATDGLDFVVTFNEVDVAVHHDGDAPTLFQEGIPVVLEGRLRGTTFDSERILVKHDETYKEKNPDRVDEGAP
jgi:cytochrome c-type biogenesis protein CcmE